MATIPTAAALDLMYRSSTTGAPTAEFDRLGGYAAVKAAAEAAGYGATPEFIQSYEIANNLPESASTKLNKQFIGSEGAAKMAQLEADLNSQNAALAAQTRANLAAQSAAADQQAAAEAAQRAAAANSGGGVVDMQVFVYGPDGTSYSSPAAARAAGVTNYTIERPANTGGGGPAGSPWSSITQEELTQMMRDSVTLRYLNEDLYTKTGKTYDTIAEAQAAQRAESAPQVAVPQAAAQQVAAQQAAIQQAALQRAAQARSVGLLDAAPAPRAAAPAINRPTGIAQPSYTQVAPAQITNRAITGTPYSSIYSPATMQQNMPSLANIQAAARSANPYAALMALTPQRALSPAYATQAGVAGANSYLGGFNPNIYNPATTPVTGLLNTTGRGNDGAGGNVGSNAGSGGGGFTGSTNIGGVSGTTTGVASAANSLAAFLGNLGLTTISDAIAKNVDPNYSHEGRGATGGGVDPQTGLQGQGSTGQTGLYGDAAAGMSSNTAQQGFRAGELAERNAFTEGITGLLGGGQLSDFDSAYAGMISDAKMEAAAMAAANAAQYGPQIDATAANVQAAQDAAAFAGAQAAADAAAADAAQAASDNADNPSGGYDGGYSGGYDGGGDPGGGGPFAKGGMVNMKPQMRNPPGPDDGYAALDNGEYVIRKKAVKKYGSNIFEQINAGRIPAQRLKSLLE